MTKPPLHIPISNEDGQVNLAWIQWFQEVYDDIKELQEE